MKIFTISRNLLGVLHKYYSVRALTHITSILWNDRRLINTEQKSLRNRITTLNKTSTRYAQLTIISCILKSNSCRRLIYFDFVSIIRSNNNRMMRYYRPNKTGLFCKVHLVHSLEGHIFEKKRRILPEIVYALTHFPRNMIFISIWVHLEHWWLACDYSAYLRPVCNWWIIISHSVSVWAGSISSNTRIWLNKLIESI